VGENNAQFDMNTQQKRAFIQALEQCHTMRDRAARDAVVLDLPFGQAIIRHHSDRLDLSSIVDAGLRYPNGLNELLESIGFYEGNSLPLHYVIKIWEDIQKQNEPIKTTPPPTFDPRPIQFDWVTIPAGEFIMGSNDGGDDEKPQHKVYLPEYQISRTPITNEQWAVFLKTTGYKDWYLEYKPLTPKGQEKHPVVYIEADNCLAFCEWSKTRLPTEAEWEKAARGTDGRKWPWGNQEPTISLANFNDNVGGTTPVGMYPQGASPYGCLDMAGNVEEWCNSEFRAYPYKSGDGRENGQVCEVTRGGSFVNYANSIRTTSRFHFDRYEDYVIDSFIRMLGYHGFRVVSVPIS